MSAFVLLSFGAALLAVVVLIASPESLAERLRVRVSYRRPQESVLVRVQQIAVSITKKLTFRTKRADLGESVSLFEVLTLAERLLAAGDSTAGAIEWISGRVSHSRRTSSTVFAGLQRVAMRIRSGGTLTSELQEWQRGEPNRETQEFLAKLLAATRQGSGVIDILKSLSQSVDSAIKARQISAFSGTETRMMVPLVFLVLPLTVLFAVFPSMSLLNLEL
ncbi:MAG: type II secretion system F family protein [Micrococcales bacterium]